MRRLFISDHIPVLLFESQREVAATFLRPQEYYESPEFRGEVFTLEEFKEYYAERYGAFTYYEDWNGFNIPSHVLPPFYEGEFDPLSAREKNLLKACEGCEHPFYVIGTHTECPAQRLKLFLRHELGHAFFYTDPVYLRQVMAVMCRHDLGELEDAILSFRNGVGYHEDLVEDECQAWALDPERAREKLGVAIPLSLTRAIGQFYACALDRARHNSAPWVEDDIDEISSLLQGGCDGTERKD